MLIGVRTFRSEIRLRWFVDLSLGYAGKSASASSSLMCIVPYISCQRAYCFSQQTTAQAKLLLPVPRTVVELLTTLKTLFREQIQPPQ